MEEIRLHRICRCKGVLPEASRGAVQHTPLHHEAIPVERDCLAALKAPLAMAYAMGKENSKSIQPVLKQQVEQRKWNNVFNNQMDHRDRCCADRYAVCHAVRVAIDLPGNKRIWPWDADDARLRDAHADDGRLWFLRPLHVAVPAGVIDPDRVGDRLPLEEDHRKVRTKVKEQHRSFLTPARSWSGFCFCANGILASSQTLE